VFFSNVDKITISLIKKNMIAIGVSGWGKRIKELDLRWAELAVFSPCKRKYEGNRLERNAQYYDDPDLVKTIGYLVGLHDALHPYLQTMEEKYQSKGLPFIREMSLHYPKSKAGVLLPQGQCGGKGTGTLQTEMSTYKKGYRVEEISIFAILSLPFVSLPALRKARALFPFFCQRPG
jgi:hypothetical protein